jgi:hypothetical protein
VILIDANLLLYAYHPRAEEHEASRAAHRRFAWPRRME